MPAATYVPPTGPQNSKIAFVFEQPGKQEVMQRQPLVGPAGKEFNLCLAEAGLSRREVYLTNVIKDLDHNLSYYCTKRYGAYSGFTEAGQKYVDELKQELQQISPNVVVAAGNLALLALRGHGKITKWRGSVIESTLLPGLKLVPMLHTSTVLRGQPTNRYLIISDIRKAIQESESPEITQIPRSIMIKPSYFDAMEFLERCMHSSEIVSYDIEVDMTSFQVSCISFALSKTEAISIPFQRGSENYWTLEEETSLWIKIANVLESPNTILCGQNVIFDTHFLLRRYGIKACNLHDTMIAQKIIYPDFRVGLDFIASYMTSIPYYKDDGKAFIKGTNNDLERFWKYNALDSITCSEAFPHQREVLEKQDNLATYERQRRMILPLTYMMEHGILIDMEKFRKIKAEKEAKLFELESQFHDLAGNVNYASPKQLCDLFYNKLGHKPYVNRQSGNPTTNELALKRLVRKGVEEASLVLKIRKVKKQLTTYLIEENIDHDSRYRSQYNPAGTPTGRLSSSKNIFGTGGNQQNWPHSLLGCFIADPGYILYSFDLAQAENRIVAYVGNVTQMIQAFENHLDLHRLTASLIFDIPYSEVSDEPGSCTLGGGEASQRFWGKKANHGLNYDLGYKTFALYYEIPESQAKWIVERYHRAYLGVRNSFHTQVRRSLKESRMLVNCMGRKRLFLEPWGNALFKDAYAHIPQSTVADIINERGIEFIYYDSTGLFDSVELLTQIHDSIVFQIPVPPKVSWDQHATILHAIKSQLEIPLQWRTREFSIPADLSIGLNMDKSNMIELKHGDFPDLANLPKKLEEIYSNLRQNLTVVAE